MDTNAKEQLILSCLDTIHDFSSSARTVKKGDKQKTATGAVQPKQKGSVRTVGVFGANARVNFIIPLIKRILENKDINPALTNNTQIADILNELYTKSGGGFEKDKYNEVVKKFKNDTTDNLYIEIALQRKITSSADIEPIHEQLRAIFTNTKYHFVIDRCSVLGCHTQPNIKSFASWFDNGNCKGNADSDEISLEKGKGDLLAIDNIHGSLTQGLARGHIQIADKTDLLRETQWNDYRPEVSKYSQVIDDIVGTKNTVKLFDGTQNVFNYINSLQSPKDIKTMVLMDLKRAGDSLQIQSATNEKIFITQDLMAVVIALHKKHNIIHSYIDTADGRIRKAHIFIHKGTQNPALDSNIMQNFKSTIKKRNPTNYKKIYENEIRLLKLVLVKANKNLLWQKKQSNTNIRLIQQVENIKNEIDSIKNKIKEYNNKINNLTANTQVGGGDEDIAFNAEIEMVHFIKTLKTHYRTFIKKHHTNVSNHLLKDYLDFIVKKLKTIRKYTNEDIELVENLHTICEILEKSPQNLQELAKNIEYVLFHIVPETDYFEVFNEQETSLMNVTVTSFSQKRYIFLHYLFIALNTPPIITSSISSVKSGGASKRKRSDDEEGFHTPPNKKNTIPTPADFINLDYEEKIKALKYNKDAYLRITYDTYYKQNNTDFSSEKEAMEKTIAYFHSPTMDSPTNYAMNYYKDIGFTIFDFFVEFMPEFLDIHRLVEINYLTDREPRNPFKESTPPVAIPPKKRKAETDPQNRKTKK